MRTPRKDNKGGWQRIGGILQCAYSEKEEAPEPKLIPSTLVVGGLQQKEKRKKERKRKKRKKKKKSKSKKCKLKFEEVKVKTIK